MSQEAPRIYLSPPHMVGREREYLMDAFDSNWIAPLGPHVNAFETEFAAKVAMPAAAALASGTSALHLAMLIVGVKPGDEVLTSSFTFVATANAITYLGAKPVFVDSDEASWNMDPDLLEKELASCKAKGRLPAAVVVVDILGQCADYGRITKICQEYKVPLIEDAAETLGATYDGKPAGSFGEIACFSFNGNKIITSSGGGMLVSNNKDWVDKARYLSTQAREPAPHYEHVEIGFNYRMSNLVAAVGRGQLEKLEELVDKRRSNFEYYQSKLGELPGVEFMPEIENGRSTRWLTSALIDPEKFGATREDIRLALEAENIESRPAWKPMHMQAVFSKCRMVGGKVCELIFEHGISLPSGTALTTEELDRVVGIVRSVGKH